MKKADLISAMAEQSGISKASAEKALDAFVQSLVQVGRESDSLSVPGLGVFKGKIRAARTGRNPATGEALEVPEKKTLTFTLSKGVSLD